MRDAPTLFSQGSRRRSLSEAERLDWVRLMRTMRVGSITFYRLMESFGDAAAALQAVPELAKRGGAKPIRPPALAPIQRERDQLAKLGGRFIAACEPEYPEALAFTEDAPPVLTVIGDADLLLQCNIAIVGARNASLNGRNLATRLARGLGALGGRVIVSGLARGIDTAAHEGALETGTVAVLGGGADVPYPPENEDLYRRIAEKGCIVTEESLGVQPMGRHFPKRNRIISGLCPALVVVEAAQKSGSLITARLANDQGRTVLAVPGSPMDPRASGTNRLIRDGARLVQSVEDILEELEEAPSFALKDPRSDLLSWSPPYIAEGQELEKARIRVEEALGPAPTAVDELIRDCQLTPALVQTVLLELELAGRLERMAGNRICLVA